MKKEEIFKLMNENPSFHLATVEGDQPRVRGMLLFRADEEGIIFHTADTKDVYSQLKANPKAELCFNSSNGIQVRACGELEEVEDEELKAEIYNHPTRKFLQAWENKGVKSILKVFVMKKAKAVIWTFDKNFDEKEYIGL